MPRSRRAARVEVTLTGPDVIKDLFEGSAEGTSPMREWPWTHVRVLGIEQPVWIVAGTDEHGRPAITGLLLSPKQNVEILSRDLRAIPLGQILMLVDRVLLPRVRTPAYKPPPIKPGPTGWDRKHFERIAAEYRRALVDDPKGPVRTLALRVGKSEATVHRWLQRCRDMELLGPTRIERSQARRQQTPARRVRKERAP